MDATIGTAVLMESSGALDRIRCQLVGFVRDEYVVLKLPLIPGIRTRVVEGAMLTFRYLQRGRLISFRSVVKSFVATPYSLLFVSYPKRLETHDLRREQRFTCNFPAWLRFVDRTFEGLVLDLSPGGCRFFFDAKNSPPPANLRKGSRVQGEFRPPAGEPVAFRASVASVEDYRRTHTASLSFGENEPPLSPELAVYLSETQQVLNRMYAIRESL